MPYTNEQQAEFKRQFAARRKRQVLLAVPMIVLVILVVILRESDRQDVFGLPAAVWGPAFLAVVLGALIFSFRNWRFPACDRYLGRQMSPKFCSKCGVALQ